DLGGTNVNGSTTRAGTDAGGVLAVDPPCCPDLQPIAYTDVKRMITAINLPIFCLPSSMITFLSALFSQRFQNTDNETNILRKHGRSWKNRLAPKIVQPTARLVVYNPSKLIPVSCVFRTL